MTFEEGAVCAIADMGIGVLDEPTRLVGYLKDVCGNGCLEVTVLERNCDDVLLSSFREAADAGTPEALDVSRRRMLAVLVGERGIDAGVAQRICVGLAVAVAFLSALQLHGVALDGIGSDETTAVSAGTWHTVAVRSNGTVLATGDNSYGRCDVSDW